MTLLPVRNITVRWVGRLALVGSPEAWVLATLAGFGIGTGLGVWLAGLI